MSLLIFIFFARLSHFAYAQEANKPFVLPDGKYNLECWGLNVSRNAENGIDRLQNFQRGVDEVSTANGKILESLTLHNEDGSQSATMTRSTATQDLGGGRFEQVVEVRSGPKAAVFKVKLKAEGEFNLMLSGSWDGNPVDVKGREFRWMKMTEGRIFVQDYLLATPTKLFSATTCIYTPIPAAPVNRERVKGRVSSFNP